MSSVDSKKRGGLKTTRLCNLPMTNMLRFYEMRLAAVISPVPVLGTDCVPMSMEALGRMPSSAAIAEAAQLALLIESCDTEDDDEEEVIHSGDSAEAAAAAPPAKRTMR